MASCKSLVGLVLFVTIFTFCDALKPGPVRHYVNGGQGWVPYPSQGYNQWAGTHRFLTNDTLVFRYDKEHDSVVEVSEQDYNTCNTDHPIMKAQDGETEISLPHPGPFYFISGNKSSCEQGEKMIVKVLSYPHTPSSAAPISQPPTAPLVPAPQAPPVSHPPTAGLPPQAPSPATPSSPASSPSTPVTPGTATSPPSGAPAASAPAMPPTASAPTAASPPATSPTSTVSPASSPATSETPASSPSGTAADVAAPAPTKSGGESVRSFTAAMAIGVLSSAFFALIMLP